MPRRSGGVVHPRQRDEARHPFRVGVVRARAPVPEVLRRERIGRRHVAAAQRHPREVGAALHPEVGLAERRGRGRLRDAGRPRPRPSGPCGRGRGSARRRGRDRRRTVSGSASIIAVVPSASCRTAMRALASACQSAGTRGSVRAASAVRPRQSSMSSRSTSCAGHERPVTHRGSPRPRLRLIGRLRQARRITTAGEGALASVLERRGEAQRAGARRGPLGVEEADHRVARQVGGHRALGMAAQRRPGSASRGCARRSSRIPASRRRLRAAASTG